MSSVQKQCIDIKSQEDCNIQENCSWASGKKRSFCRTKKNKHDVEDKKKPSTKGRCKKGTRRNKATGLCEKHKASSAKASPVSASPVSASPVVNDIEEFNLGEVIDSDDVSPQSIVSEVDDSEDDSEEDSEDDSEDDSEEDLVPEPHINKLEVEYQNINVGTTKERSKKMIEFEMNKEKINRAIIKSRDRYPYLYPSLDDEDFNIKIAEKKEFSESKYEGKIKPVAEEAEKICNSDFELAPQQIFVRNFLSFQTPYNSLLLYHGLGSGKTCSAIGIGEEMRDYLKQIGSTHRIIIVASPNVQENFKVQLFDERKLRLIDGLWNLRSCTGNKYLKEINPMNMKGLSKENVVKQIKRIINTSYVFMGYIQFANYIHHKSEVDTSIDKKRQAELRRINLQKVFNNRLIIIDEVHNIRVTDDNSNKRVATEVMKLVKIVPNLRLLLLSATPLYNSYKEVVWLLNLMNINDNRTEIKEKYIFNSDGTFKTNDAGEDVGREILIRKATGYISFVRGENPYTFPFRIWPPMFTKENTFNKDNRPTYQLNGQKIIQPLEHISLFLTNLGSYQEKGYRYILHSIRKNFKKEGDDGEDAIFKNMESFGYTLLQRPLEGLNIIYPNKKLDAFELEEYDLIGDDEESEEDIDEESEGGIGDDSDEVDEESDELEEDIEDIDEDIEEIDKDLVDVVDDAGESATEDKAEDASSDVDSGYESEVDVRDLDDNAGEIKKGVPAKLDYYYDENGITQTGGTPSPKELDEEEAREIFDAKIIVGKEGLRNIMTYKSGGSSSVRSDFEYKETGYGSIFSPTEIGKYSGKMKKICDSIMSSTGVILIYSQYIDGGLVPIALALEELGFTRAGGNSLFKTPPTERIDAVTLQPESASASEGKFSPAHYTMITGDKSLSPNNAVEVGRLTNIENKDGSSVKVVLISQAGSEGLDFKFIRQVHILEPWYNMNRIEQIIGRAVRTCSHKDLPLEERNVEIYLYGSLMDNVKIEAVDVYVYRHAERKSINIGRVSRALKESAVDCLLNIEQTNFTVENMNQTITQNLSSGASIQYQVGDRPYSAICDYTESCQYSCTPNKNITDINDDTYMETFIMMTTEKIIQRIRALFKEKFVYSKKSLIGHINAVRSYPSSQINAALHQLVEDKSEYITDKYGRLGNLINIDQLYLYQPIELKQEKISTFERSIPIPYKRKSVEIEQEIALPSKMHFGDEDEVESSARIIEKIRSQYIIGSSPWVVERGVKDWYRYCGATISTMENELGISKDILLRLLTDHIIESLLFEEIVILLNHLETEDARLDPEFSKNIKAYFDEKYLIVDNMKGLLLHNSKKTPPRTLIVKKLDELSNKWVEGDDADMYRLRGEIKNKIVDIQHKHKKRFNKYIGYISEFKKDSIMVFKIKDFTNERNKGARCDQSSKGSATAVLKKIFIHGGEEDNINKFLDASKIHLCAVQELYLRYYNYVEQNDLTWFVTPIDAIMHNLDK